MDANTWISWVAGPSAPWGTPQSRCHGRWPSSRPACCIALRGFGIQRRWNLPRNWLEPPATRRPSWAAPAPRRTNAPSSSRARRAHLGTRSRWSQPWEVSTAGRSGPWLPQESPLGGVFSGHQCRDSSMFRSTIHRLWSRPSTKAPAPCSSSPCKGKGVWWRPRWSSPAPHGNRAIGRVRC
jgi:hypothetical protein